MAWSMQVLQGGKSCFLPCFYLRKPCGQLAGRR